jgi:hypothetical protein
VVAGRVLVEGGHSTYLDEHELRANYLRALRSFSARQLGVAQDVLCRVIDPYLRSPTGRPHQERSV